MCISAHCLWNCIVMHYNCHYRLWTLCQTQCVPGGASSPHHDPHVATTKRFSTRDQLRLRSTRFCYRLRLIGVFDLLLSLLSRPRGALAAEHFCTLFEIALCITATTGMNPLPNPVWGGVSMSPPLNDSTRDQRIDVLLRWQLLVAW